MKVMTAKIPLLLVFYLSEIALLQESFTVQFMVMLYMPSKRHILIHFLQT